MNGAFDAASSLTPAQSLGDRVGLAFARARWAVGTPGLVGVVLVVAAAGWLVSGWLDQRSVDARRQEVVAVPTPSRAVTAAAAVSATRLPSLSQVPVLLERLERTATTEGIGWPKADYRVTGATAQLPASLEVRCALKASYPSLRRFVGAILRDTPSLTFRELSFGRATSTEATVDAKMTLVIYLDSPGGAGVDTGDRGQEGHVEARR